MVGCCWLTGCFTIIRTFVQSAPTNSESNCTLRPLPTVLSVPSSSSVLVRLFASWYLCVTSMGYHFLSRTLALVHTLDSIISSIVLLWKTLLFHQNSPALELASSFRAAKGPLSLLWLPQVHFTGNSWAIHCRFS